MSPTKTELEEGLAKAEAKVARLERRLSENTRSPEVVETGDRLAQIESLISAEIAENPDDGTGIYGGWIGLQSAVGYLRDAQRAWQHIANAAPSSGAARDAALEESLAQ